VEEWLAGFEKRESRGLTGGAMKMILAEVFFVHF
jgi:hypothetical protein